MEDLHEHGLYTAFLTPAQFVAAAQKAPSAPPRIVPVAAGRAAQHAESLRRQHIPGSVYVQYLRRAWKCWLTGLMISMI